MPIRRRALEEIERILKHRYNAPNLQGFARIAVGEAYTKLLEKEQELGAELPPQERLTYLKRVAKNKILNEIQRHRNDDQIEDKNKNKKKRNQPIIFGDDEKNQMDLEDNDELLDKLSSAHSEVLKMHYRQGFSVKQIAEEIGISVDGVKKRLKYAKKEAQQFRHGKGK